jgi:hypothetical protein
MPCGQQFTLPRKQAVDVRELLRVLCGVVMYAELVTRAVLDEADFVTDTFATACQDIEHGSLASALVALGNKYATASESTPDPTWGASTAV